MIDGGARIGRVFAGHGRMDGVWYVPAFQDRSSTCMTDKGYDFTTAAEPPALYGEQESITEVELATRAADLQCDRAVALTGAQSEFERERADAWMDEHATLVDELMTRRTEVQRAIVASWEEVQHAAC